MSNNVDNGIAMFRETVAKAKDEIAIHYFERKISYGSLDEQSDALAVALIERGFEPGDRLAVYMQNIPQFAIALIACWKAGGVFLPINPMNRAHELGYLYQDASPKAIIMEPELFIAGHAKIADTVIPPKIIMTASPIDQLTQPDSRLFQPDVAVSIDNIESVNSLISEFKGQKPPSIACAPDDTAMLVYTSGTTGNPKGAIISQKGVVIGAQLAQQNTYLPDGASMLAIAPLFHITGLMVNLLSTIRACGSLTLCYRFHPEATVEQIIEKRPMVTVGAITAYIAIMNIENIDAESLSSLKVVAAGGAPIPPMIHKKFLEKFGINILNGYGMTETSSVAVMVDEHAEQRIDPDSGALSVGTPAVGCAIYIIDENGEALPAGEVGEIIIDTPAVTAGYWNNPEATQASLHPLGWRSGDVGKLDADGWLYIVDRKKDMIIASGFKVWPREVEDALYEHPAIREVAVVGIPDEYRGESVKAFISLNAGTSLTGDDVIEFAKERLSAYKRPRVVEILDELPKTPTGKILRRALRPD